MVLVLNKEKFLILNLNERDVSILRSVQSRK
jgi:hypothetical protein